ncbi:hypothetical protein GV819_22630 [Pseudomonas sp. Fl5BN2]|uniref:hypothetical protein n=1 Tax=Pseudomonas sp. Fl5BN2 TaxID=2697652 RepID=UPI001377AEE5|nr:hypothetical protein [Pseudomonas sp. Fl5BN2]NBF05086.1 hypothetical protein [Pseudomonas sp. Fl5BN2]
MTSISAITANPYPVAAPKAAVDGHDETGAGKLQSMDDTSGTDGQELRVNSPDASIDAVKASGNSIEELEKQIEQTQEMLAQQQAQLADMQKSQASDEQKAMQAMEMQTQIAVTSSNLLALQAALLQAIFGIDVHA